MIQVKDVFAVSHCDGHSHGWKFARPRIKTWPEEVQDELVAVANQTESELRGRDYLATREELQVVDAAMASIDGGEIASDIEIKAAFAKFRRA